MIDEEWSVAIVGVALALAWTLLGFLIAAVSDQLQDFVREWLLIQGTFDVMAALFLVLLARSRALESALDEISAAEPLRRAYSSRNFVRLRWLVIAGIASVGTVSTVQLGFRVEPPSRYFMWSTCFIVCLAAGRITWHFVEILLSAASLPAAKLEIFSYAPSETTSLRKIATYYSVFGAATTVGYFFAFIGTVANDWQGNPAVVRSVQAMWPTIYVPCCLLLLAYPHLAIRRIVRRAKDDVISNYQRQINELLSATDSLTPETISRVNTLADVISRVQKTPNFPVRIPIMITATITAIVNFATLVLPQEALAQLIKSRLPWP